MEFDAFYEEGYKKCNECYFFTKSNDEIKEHITFAHQWLLNKKQKLSEKRGSETNPLKKKSWKDLFLTTGPEVSNTIFSHMDTESFLACRLVCQGWRPAVNKYKPKWFEIKSTYLKDALISGQVYVTEMLIANTAHVAVDEYNNFPLHLASFHGHTAMVEMLLSYDVDVNCRDFDTPLCCAAGEGKTDIVRILLREGALVDAEGGFGETALHKAAENGHLAVAQLLIDHGSNINKESNWMSTALHFSCSEGHETLIELLISHGADINARDDMDRTPLDLTSKDSDIYKMLVTRGAVSGSRPFL